MARKTQKGLRKRVRAIAKRGNLNIGKYNIDQLVMGIEVEREHCTKKTHPEINVCFPDDGTTPLRIAMAHLDEFPDYYNWLGCMENAMGAKTDRARMKIICEKGMGGEYADNVYEWDGHKAVCKVRLDKKRRR